MSGKKLKLLMCVMLSMCLYGCSTTGASTQLDTEYKMANKKYEDGEYQEAVKFYQQFQQKRPESVLNKVVHYYLGKSYVRLGQKDKAKQEFQQLIKNYDEGYWVDSAKKELNKLN